MVENIKMKSRIRVVAIYFFFLLGVVLIFRAYQEARPYIKLTQKQKELQLLAEPAKKNTDVITEHDPMERKIDFDKLREINEDIIAWIYAPGIGVDHPVLKGKSDTEYLSKDFEGKYNPLGSVFTFADTKDDFIESRIFIFAHNTYSKEMFGQLEKYEDSEFLKSNKKIYIYLPNRVMELEAVDTDTKIYNDPFFQQKEDVEQSIILVTCSNRQGDAYRFVVQFKVSKQKWYVEEIYEEQN